MEIVSSPEKFQAIRKVLVNSFNFLAFQKNKGMVSFAEVEELPHQNSHYSPYWIGNTEITQKLYAEVMQKKFPLVKEWKPFLRLPIGTKAKLSAKE